MTLLRRLTKRRHAPAVSRIWVAEWAVTLIIMLFAYTTIAWSYVVPTGSMEKTVLVGDHMIVDKLAYGTPGPVSRFLLPYEQPRHGDIIVFTYPVDPATTLVKRLVGLPGDRIRIVDGQLIRNGVAVNEPYVWHSMPFADPFAVNFPSANLSPGILRDGKREARMRDMLDNHVVNGEVVVPSDSYFAMGDNRDNSLDSRYWGFVPRDSLIGKPVLVYWSYEATERDLMASSGTDVAHHILDLGEHFFTRTRWSRTLLPIQGYPDPK